MTMFGKKVLGVVLAVGVMAGLLPVTAIGDTGNPVAFKTVIVTEGSTTYTVNGTKQSWKSPVYTSPEADVMMIPLAPIAEIFGASVFLKPNDRVELTYGDSSFSLNAGSNSITKNGTKVYYMTQFNYAGGEPTPAELKVGTLYIPYRSLSYIFDDLAIGFDANTRSIIFTMYKEPPKPVTKKAIYVLPGYLDSELFINNNEKIWIDWRLAVDFFTPLDSPLSNGNNGTGMIAQAGSTDPEAKDYDDYGKSDKFKTLINSLRDEYVYDEKYKGSGEYDVIFFPYNWLGDLNDSTDKLEAHINEKKYSKVIFVTHSTGGLLASSYIARGSNNTKVEKAILIAAPLYGTYSALEPIEFGTTGEIQGYFDLAADAGNWLGGKRAEFGVRAIEAYFETYVRSITKNAPTTYQLLPGEEYLKEYPIMTSWWEARWSFVIPYAYVTNNNYNTSSGFYTVLNNRDYTTRTNQNLTNGNVRSHKYFRETVLKNNIADVLLSVGRSGNDVLLIGNKSDIMTPTVAHYTNWGITDFDFDGSKLEMIYEKTGDGTVTGFSATLNNRLSDRYANYPGVKHSELVKNPQVINRIISEISGGKTRSFSAVEAQMLSISDDASDMSNMLKLDVFAPFPVGIEIYDVTTENVVAGVTDAEESFGFDDINFLYRSKSSDPDVTDALIYLPNGGYNVRFLLPEGKERDKLSVLVSPLTNEGNRVGVGLYELEALILNTLILKIGSTGVTMATMPPVVAGNGLTQLLLTASNMASFNVNWELNTDSLVFNTIGESKRITVTGSAANNLIWSSSDPAVVSVDEYGQITTKGYGFAKIYAAANDFSGKIESVDIKVTLAPTSVRWDNVTLLVDERLVIAPVFNSKSVTETDVTYSYDNNGIIDIEDNKVLLGLSPGTAIVTGTTSNGKSATFTVKVKNIYTIAATAETGGTITGGGDYTEGAMVKLTATPNNGYAFAGWYEHVINEYDDWYEEASKKAAYTFAATADIILEARFAPAFEADAGSIMVDGKKFDPKTTVFSDGKTYEVTFTTDGGKTSWKATYKADKDNEGEIILLNAVKK